MSAQIHERRVPFERPPVIRAMLTLSVASEVLARARGRGSAGVVSEVLARKPDAVSPGTFAVASEVLARGPGAVPPGTFAAHLQLREQTQDFDAWYATIVAGSTPGVLTATAQGTTVLGIVAPPALAEDAYRDGLPIRRIFSFGNCEVVCAALATDDFVRACCKAVETRKHELGIPALVDYRDCLRTRNKIIPLHVAAEQFWLG